MQQDDKPQPDIRPPGDDPAPPVNEPEPSEQPGRPTPSGVPNEIQATDNRTGTYTYLGERVYEYKPVRLRSGWCNERAR